MATRKITITVAGELADAIAAAARDEGVPVSRVYAEAAARELRLRAGRALIAQWQAEHGAFTPEELASARAELAGADAEMLGSAGRSSA